MLCRPMKSIDFEDYSCQCSSFKAHRSISFHVYIYIYIYGGVSLFNLAIDPDLGDLFVEDLFQVKNHLVF